MAKITHLQPSRVSTVSIPTIGTDNPATLVRAPRNKVLRVLVRNVGGVIIYLAHETGDLATFGNASAGSYRLPAGQTDVFVLMPEQGLYAAAQGASAFASIAVSEALPAFFGES